MISLLSKKLQVDKDHFFLCKATNPRLNQIKSTIFVTFVNEQGNQMAQKNKNPLGLKLKIKLINLTLKWSWVQELIQDHNAGKQAPSLEQQPNFQNVY